MDWTLIAIIEFIFVIFGWIIINYLNNTIQKKINEIEKLQDELDKIEEINNKDMAEYSDKILDFVQRFTIQVSKICYRSFSDSKQLNMVTRMNIENLIKEISNRVYRSIDIDKVDFDQVLFTKEFLETYIIDNTILSVKKLLNDQIDDNVEGGIY